MKLITVNKILQYDPCWKIWFNDEEYEYDTAPMRALIGDGVTPLELIGLVGTTCKWRTFTVRECVWVLTRPGVLPEAVVVQAADRIVDRAVKRHALPCPATQRWLSGEDRTVHAAYAVSAVYRYVEAGEEELNLQLADYASAIREGEGDEK